MFRWVACQLDYLSELLTDSDRLEALDVLPPTLHDSYLRILRRLSKLPQKTQYMVQLCLRILAIFPRSLTIQHLCQAVSTPGKLGARLEDIVDEDSIARKCSSLIRKSADGNYFEFAHFTVQEFLTDETLLKLPEFASYRISKSQDQPKLGLLCLKFVQLQNFDLLSSGVPEMEKILLGTIKSLSFYHVAAMEWPRLTADGLNSPDLLDAAKSLFRPTMNKKYYLWAYKFSNVLSFLATHGVSAQYNKAFTDETASGKDGLIASLHPLHIAAALNLPEICSFLIQQGVSVNKPSMIGSPLDLSQASFLRFHYWYMIRQGSSLVLPSLESDLLKLTSPCSERRNATLTCLLEGGATFPTTLRGLFLYSTIISWNLQDFSSTIALLSSNFVPPQEEIKFFGGYIDSYWRTRQHSSRLEVALEDFNNYLQQSSTLSSDWGFALGNIVWSAAVAMELPFTKDPSRTDTRISLSAEALKTQIVFAIAEDNSQSLTTYLDDGRVSVSEIGCSRHEPSDTLLLLAVKRNAVNCVRLLLEWGIDPYIKDQSGDNAIIWIGVMGNHDVLDCFVPHDVSLLTTGLDDETIWHAAANTIGLNTQFLDMLFTLNIKETQQGLLMKRKDGMTPLAVALNVQQNRANTPSQIEESTLAFVNLCNDVPGFWETQEPVFPTAFGSGSKIVVQRLLELRDDPKTSGFSDSKPLHCLTARVSWQWVEYLKSLFPGAAESRYLGRLPFECYLDACLRAGQGPDYQVLDHLSFDGLFNCRDNKEVDPWSFLCSAGDRFALELLQRNWTVLNIASTYFLSHGCIQAYELSNNRCGLDPLLSFLSWWSPGPFDVVDNQVLSQAITTSQRWDPKSIPSIRFLKGAIWNRRQATVEVLLEHGVDLHDTVDNLTALEWACVHAHTWYVVSSQKDIMKLLFSHSRPEELNIFSSSNPGLGLVHFLAHPDWEEAWARWMINQLVAQGIDINGVDKQIAISQRQTPLVHHIMRSSFLCAELLLDKGANPNGEEAPDNTDETFSLRPVHACVIHGNVPLLRKILQISRETNMAIDWEAVYPFDPDDKDDGLIGPMTAFHMVCYKGLLEAFDFFVKEDLVDVELKTSKGVTPLHLAALCGHEAIIIRLVECGHEVMVLDEDDYTPLHFAIMGGSAEATRALIHLGARDSLSDFRQSARELAAENGSTELSEILEAELPVIETSADNTDVLESESSGSEASAQSDEVLEPSASSLLDQLKEAIEEGSLQDCQDLRAKGCPLDGVIARTNGLSPLIYSMKHGGTEITDWLLCQEVSTVQYCYTDGVSPVTAMDVVLKDEDLTDILPTFLSKFTDQGGDWQEDTIHSLYGAIVEQNDSGLKTVLTYLDTISSGKGSTQQFLARILARPFCARNEVWEGKYASTILDDAVTKDNVGAARLLLEYGAPIDTVDSDGDTPLAWVKSREMAELFVKYGASITPLLTETIPTLLERWGDCATKVVNTLARSVAQEDIHGPLTWLDWSSPKFYHLLQNSEPTISSLIKLRFLRPSSNHTWKTDSYLLGTEYGSGLGYILNSDVELGDMEPFPWYSHSSRSFARMTFLGFHFHHLCRRFGSETIARFANLNPETGWSPLCRAASQNATCKMENCLSLGADIEFEGCPLGSALMIASACGQLDAVKLLVRKEAKVCYTGKHGLLNVLSVARSRSVWSWLLVGRFNDQPRINQAAHDEVPKQTKPWSGFYRAKHNLNGFEYIRDKEARIDYAKRLARYKRKMRGRVAPYIEGLMYDRDVGYPDVSIR